MTYNILDGGRQREGLIAEVLRATQPDIAILQELAHRDTLKQFATLLNADCFFAPSNTARHVGLISRYPINQACSHRPFPPIRTTILQPIPSTRCMFLGCIWFHISRGH
jgi:hypothetical protein